MRHARFRWYLVAAILWMMADNIEHVISYWVMFQRFHSAALGGFAVLSHWLPFLFFSVAVGALAERVDPRRLIQLGLVLFIGVSLTWGYFFVAGTLTMVAAMALLAVHGTAAVLTSTAAQLLLHDLVPHDDLPSAIRMNASGRYLGTLAGPAVGGGLLLALGPANGIFVNACFYVPLFVWTAWGMMRARYARENTTPRPTQAVRGIADILDTARDIARNPAIVSMTLLAAGASAFVGNSYQAQMPNFAHDLGHGDPGVAYSMLLAADAAGALTAAVMLESVARLRTTPANALLLALGWAAALVAFALCRSYPLALACLFAAGFLELSFSSMAQAVVQIQAPADSRGRVLGLYGMAALGCRAFAGVTVGITGALLGVHVSLAIAGAMVMLFVLALIGRIRRRAPLPPGGF